MEGNRLRILYIINHIKYLYTHRLGLIESAVDAGYNVIVATPQENLKEIELNNGRKIDHFTIEIDRGMIGPLKEAKVVYEIAKMLRILQPDIVHNFTPKPVIYGGIAARLVKVPVVVQNINGLGTLYSQHTLKNLILRQIVKVAYRISFGNERILGIFQNPDDQKEFIRSKIVKRNDTIIVKGSGVDPEVFKYKKEKEGIPIVMLISRMLWYKGIGEFVEIARRIRKAKREVRFVLVGNPDKGNPSSIPQKVLLRWQEEGDIEWWGHRENIPDIISKCTIACLPTTYREGIPKSLIESASCGRAIVTTNVPGCREIVRHGHNGYLAKPKNIDEMEKYVIKLLDDKQLREKLGRRGREMVKKEFSLEKVIKDTLIAYKKLEKN